MTGSLQVKKDMYYVVLRHKGVDGIWHTKWCSTGLCVNGNKRKAERMRDEIVESHRRNSVPLGSSAPFVDVIRSWLADLTNPSITTIQGYEETINNHIIPYFSKLALKMHEVTTPVLQEYYTQKHLRGRLDGKGGLSAKSIRQHHAVINQVFDYALRLGFVTANPAKWVRLPSIENYNADFYSIDEVQQLLSVCEETPLKTIVLLTVYYGLRRSEVMGLRWNAVDFQRRQLKIQHVAVRRKTVVYKDATKNKSSRRVYPLLPHIALELQKVKRQQELNRQLLGIQYCDSDYIFTWDNGRVISPDYPSKAFPRILMENGLRKIRFHDLRHSCASMLYALGFGLVDIKEWLGHSDIKVTGNIYAHLDTKRKIDMAEKLVQELLG